MDKLYQFWDHFLWSYETQKESKIDDQVKPSDKVFDFLKRSSDKEGLTKSDFRNIQLRVEEMTINF